MHICLRPNMRGSRNFRQGGVQVSLTKKSSDSVFFLVLSLFYRSQMVKEIYHFSRFQRGSNIFQGSPTFSRGSNCLFPIETHIICDFPGGGVRTPCPPPPLDPHLLANLSRLGEIFCSVTKQHLVQYLYLNGAAWY